MANITNSHSLSEFQRNAKGHIEELNSSKEPLLLTINRKVQAVLVDPASFQEMEAQLERHRFITALQEGIKDIEQGRTRPLEEIYDELKAKHFSSSKH